MFTFASVPNRVALTACWIIVAWAMRSAAAEPLASPPEMFNDAELHSVTFLDADAGWAVGDRGVIWATVDGGRHWQRQVSNTQCRLFHVCFLNHDLGWAVGTWYEPYTHRSHGVLVRTQNGGKNWQVVPGLNLPGLKWITFFDANRGVAVGDASPLYASGVLTTKDGGRSWAAMPGDPQAWQLADFPSAQQGVLLSTNGQLATTNLLELNSSPIASNESRMPAALKTQLQGGSWLAGERGMVLHSADAARSWTSPPQPLPEEAARFDFQAVAVRQSHVWIAGNPGSCIFHSPDAGRTWYAQPTEQSLPLNNLCFLDENRGWAVGALGTILATRDGGETWRVQRQGGARAALLAVVSRPDALPWEMLVQTAGNEGYLTAVEILNRDAKSNPFAATQALRTQQACSLAGVASTHLAHQFPLSRDATYASLDQLNNAWKETPAQKAWEDLENHIVQRIRQWRPEVIITEDASPRGERPLAHLTNQLVISAAFKAADAAAYPLHRTQLGLAPWKVKKIFAARAEGQSGTLNLTATQLAPRLGCSLAELADAARGQLLDSPTLAPAKCGFELLVDHLPQGQGRRDFFSGIPLNANSEGRRALSAPTHVDMPMLSAQIQKQQSLRQLLERSINQPARGEGLLVQFQELLGGLSPAMAARSLHFLSERYEREGELTLATDAKQLLANRYAEDPLADAARFWLLQQRSSPEMASVTSSQPEDGWEKALAYSKELEKQSPQLTTSPQFKFATAAILKNRPGDQALNLFQSLAKSQEEPWSTCAAAELWLMQERGECPKKVLSCVRTDQKPLLDGRLDDAAWQLAKPATLRSLQAADKAPAGLVALTYDDEFLFVAVSCERQAERTPEKETRVRTRDASLDAHDRVEIRLDLDRDYATYYRLVVDQRGWTNDACGLNRAWDPQWFVAAGGDERYWSIEAAIPWSALATTAPQENTAWGMSLHRFLPGETEQSWTRSAQANPAVSLGLLRFK